MASKSAHKLTHWNNKKRKMSSTKPLERETRFETDRGDSEYYWTDNWIDRRDGDNHVHFI